LVALEPQLKQKSLDTEKLMEKLQIDQEEADKVSVPSSCISCKLFIPVRDIITQTVLHGGPVRVVLFDQVLLPQYSGGSACY
jgi:hypothetical protein